MYSLAGQGIPMIIPIDQAAAVRAILTDSKISRGLYAALGVNADRLKKIITQEISRGIASSLSYRNIARNIANASGSGLSNAKRIARTEGHRIQQTSARDAQYAARDRGADVVKQWDAKLDGRTRESHRRMDGEIRELDEKFSNGLMFPGDSNGPAAEVVNCRCTSDTRARWALDEDELQRLKDRAAYFGLDKTDSFEEFKKKYLAAVEKTEESGILSSRFQFFASKEKQFGKKVGKHAPDFGLDPSSPEDRKKFQRIIDDILDTASERRIGEWRGQVNEVIFHIKGSDVVVTTQSNEFITILKGGIDNARVKNARIK